MQVYATVDDLEAWLQDDVPDNAPSLLRQASLQVFYATKGAFYDADAVTGAPTDATILQAFDDATCAQVAFWIAADIDPTSGAVQPASALSRTRIGTAEVSYDPNAILALTTARTDGALQLCELAYGILEQAGLLYGLVTVYG